MAVGRGGVSTLDQNKSQEAATTTSNTLLLVNLGASFTQMTQGEGCHCTNQYLLPGH